MIPQGFKELARIGMVPKGRYSKLVRYRYMDLVTHNGSSYVALIDNPPCEPGTDERFWQLVAEKGEAGADGEGGVTGLKGSAEKDYRKGNVSLSKEDIGLGNVEDKSAKDILAELKKVHVEEAIGLKNLKDLILSKIDKTQAVTSIRGEAEDPDVSHKGDWTVTLKSLGIENVENYSLEQILQAVRDTITAPELGGVEKYEGEIAEISRRIIYGTDENTDTEHYPLIEEHKELLRIFDSLIRAETPEEAAEIIEQHHDLLILNGALLPFLQYYYRYWLEVNFLKDFHPLLKIRGEAEKFWQSDRYVVTKKGIGLENVPNEDPDTVGTGYTFYGVCLSEGNSSKKNVYVEDRFSLIEGRILYLTFSETNSAPKLELNVNDLGYYPIRLRGHKVTKHTATTFKANGSYVLQFDGEAWNFVSGSNGIINTRKLMLLKHKWMGNGPYFYNIVMKDIEGTEDFNVSLDSNDLEIEMNFGLAEIQGYSQSESGIILKAEKIPYCSLPIELTVNYK